MEIGLPKVVLYLYNVYLENEDSDNCAQLLEEELHRMLGITYVNDEHDCNVVSMNSLNIHDANDMQSHKLGDAMFDEDGIFSPPQVFLRIFIIMKACLLFMMIILMKVDLERT